MKLIFDANQVFQIDAIKSITDIFEGQPLGFGGFEYGFSGGLSYSDEGLGNRIVLSDEQFLNNLRAVQKRNGLPVSEKLAGLNFSVEMETGTGKTYVYLRTIYEINKKYGLKKFVIVVPSIAIREGVLKNLDITHDHFQSLFDKTPVDYGVYDAKRVSALRNFALSDAVQILVINIDSFAKDENIINKTNDRLTGRKPIEFIRMTNPIVIVDEPQNMETEIRKRAIESLNPSCTLRYSATHTNLYNLVYSLDPVKAYDLGLVKQIEVDSVTAEPMFNAPYILLEGFIVSKTKTAAKIRLDVETAKGVVKKTVTADAKKHDLFELSNGREIYRDLKVVEIDAANEMIELSDGRVLRRGDSLGGVADDIMKFQIRRTVEEHFRKEKKYIGKNVKVLSLFFIDRVANYRKYDESSKTRQGKFAEWFEEIFHEMLEKEAYKGLIPFPVGKVHNGYFAQDKNGKLKDSSERALTSADDDVFKLIMRDKERLLDPDEPLRFIFSHSALREGWDNPNVFQICTLNETRSELKKRQEIGRGLRLAVDMSGNRIFDRDINRLTLVANESYEDFARKLQKEIAEECGVDFKGRIKNKRERIEIKYRKGFMLDERFENIWNRINQKMVYRVRYHTDELIQKAVAALRSIPEIKKPVIRAMKVGITMDREGVGFEQHSMQKTFEISAKETIIPDVLGYIQERTELTRSTVFHILKESGRMKDILVNPQLFLDLAVSIIKTTLDELKINGIKYLKLEGDKYEMSLFMDHEIETYFDQLVHEVIHSGKTIYEKYIPLDSEAEKNFASDCERNEDIEFFFKLPKWFKIKTPIGDYNPDWALILANGKEIYFVAETKSSLDFSQLRGFEKQKIICAQAHFKEFQDVKYKVTRTISDLN